MWSDVTIPSIPGFVEHPGDRHGLQSLSMNAVPDQNCIRHPSVSNAPCFFSRKFGQHQWHADFVVVPAGSAAARPACAAGRRGGRRRGTGLLRSGPAAEGVVGAAAAAVPLRRAARTARRTRRQAAGDAWAAGKANPRAGQIRRRQRGACVGRLHPVRPSPRRRRARRARRHPAGSVRVAVSGLARPGRQEQRRTLQGVHAVLRRVAQARLAGAGQVGPEVGELDRPDRPQGRRRNTRCRSRTRSARGREGGASAVEEVRERRSRRATPTTATGPICLPPAGCRRT